MPEHEHLDRAAALDMLALTIFFIRQGKTQEAIGQLRFLIDSLNMDIAVDEVSILREQGISEAYLCQ